GCCGMAGSFGFESGRHYDVSVACGERALLPAVRQAADDTLIIANGFSCQQQIGQTTDRRPMHLAQVLQMALGSEGATSDGRAPHDALTADRRTIVARRGATLLLAGAGVALAGWLVWNHSRRSNS
ncbi:MAG TPA: (Fe-S)-binding protein, partial [Pirellulales bacterium]